MLKKLGFNVAKYPLVSIITWIIATIGIILVAVVGVGGQSLFDRLLSDQPKVPSESTTADDWLKGNGNNATEPVILILNGAETGDKAIQGTIESLTEKMEDKTYIDSVVSPTSIPEEYLKETPELQGLTADSGIVVLVNVKQNQSDTINKENINQTIVDLEKYEKDFKAEGLTIEIANATVYSEAIVDQASEDLKSGEIISLPLALIVLVLVFGGFLAAGMPLIGAIVSIVGGLGVLYGASYVLDVDTTVLNVLSVIGLGLSIDYGLLMISRFREALRALPRNDKKSVQLAIASTMDTAGRTVLFSGLTVAICTSALVFFEASIMKSIAISTAGVILLAVLASMTLLPAIFSLLGYKLIQPSPLTKIPGLGKVLSKFGDVAPKTGVFSWLAGKIQKVALPVFLLGSAFLVILGSGVLNLHVSNYGTPFLSQPNAQQLSFDKLEKDYDAFKAYDLTLVFDKNEISNLDSEAGKYTDFLKANSHISDITELATPEDSEYATLSFNVDEVRSGQEVVQDIRDYTTEQDNSETILLTGDAARDVDFNNSLLKAAPLVIGIIILTTFILLFLLTGSVIIPIKAIVLSALSLGASVGVITWGFEGGNLAGLLNFDASEIVGISPLILVLILVFGFGLAMDYEVFLISRIKEEFDKTGNARESIKNGLQGSGRIITSAGIIIVLVFMGFAFGNMLMIKQIGVALAVAVLVDMTIVRCILVPAIMTLLGKHAWWAPKGLKKIYNRFGIKH